MQSGVGRIQTKQAAVSDENYEPETPSMHLPLCKRTTTQKIPSWEDSCKNAFSDSSIVPTPKITFLMLSKMFKTNTELADRDVNLRKIQSPV